MSYIVRTMAALLLLVGFYACNNNTPAEADADATETPQGSYTLTPFAPSADFPGATLSNMRYANGQFNFDMQNFSLGEQTPDAPQKMCANSAEGQHIHLIVNNEPYLAKYSSSFEHALPDGEHYILAFLSRSYHESIKRPEAAILQKATVANQAFTDTEAVDAPMLFYSRPKGAYVGQTETEKVMLDFYLANLSLGTDYQVKVEVNGEQEFLINSWQPYYLEGLPMGDNKIRLSLVHANGELVNTPLNPVERVFTLKPDPAE
jgi:hypothetical protein